MKHEFTRIPSIRNLSVVLNRSYERVLPSWKKLTSSPLNTRSVHIIVYTSTRHNGVIFCRVVFFFFFFYSPISDGPITFTRAATTVDHSSATVIIIIFVRRQFFSFSPPFASRQTVAVYPKPTLSFDSIQFYYTQRDYCDTTTTVSRP